jgi:hypothetical protein
VVEIVDTEATIMAFPPTLAVSSDRSASVEGNQARKKYIITARSVGFHREGPSRNSRWERAKLVHASLMWPIGRSQRAVREQPLR